MLAHYLGCPEVVDAVDRAWLREAVQDIAGMVQADASEVQVAAYVRQLARSRGRSPEEIRGARLVAVALWHVAKAADERDRAVRALRAAGGKVRGAAVVAAVERSRPVTTGPPGAG